MPVSTPRAARRPLGPRLRRALRLVAACATGAVVLLVAGQIYAARGGT